MRLGLDIDGVLANFASAYEALWIRHSGGMNLFPPNTPPPTWHYPQYYGYDEALAGPIWNEIKASPSFWRSLQVLDGAREVIEWAERESTALYFVTDRPGLTSLPQTVQWFWDHFGRLPGDVMVSSDKGAACAAHRIQLYVDDKAENIADVRAKSPATTAVLLERPYNQHLAPCGEIRIRDVRDVMALCRQPAVDVSGNLLDGP